MLVFVGGIDCFFDGNLPRGLNTGFPAERVISWRQRNGKYTSGKYVTLNPFGLRTRAITTLRDSNTNLFLLTVLVPQLKSGAWILIIMSVALYVLQFNWTRLMWNFSGCSHGYTSLLREMSMVFVLHLTVRPSDFISRGPRMKKCIRSRSLFIVWRGMGGGGGVEDFDCSTP